MYVCIYIYIFLCSYSYNTLLYVTSYCSCNYMLQGDGKCNILPIRR